MVQHYIEKTDDGYEFNKIYDIIGNSSIRYTEDALKKMKKITFTPARCSGKPLTTIIERWINEG